MKRSALLFVALFALMMPQAKAQGRFGKDSAECVKYLSYYTSYMQQNDLAEATAPWRKALEICPPTASQHMLINGQKIMRRLIGLTTDPTRRKELIDSLFMLHDMRMANFPKYAVTANNNKALDMINYLKEPDDEMELFKGLDNIVNVLQEKVNPIVLYVQVKTAVDLYQKEELKADEIMSVYTRNSTIFDKVLETMDDENTQNMRKDLDNLFASSGVASCDNLVALYTPRFEANPKDENLVNTIVKMMSASNCIDKELFLNAVEALYGMEPSAATAYLLFRLYERNDDFEKAVSYMQCAIDANPKDSVQNADYYYEMATVCYKDMKNNPHAVSAAEHAMNLNPALAGKCYMLIGYVWGSVRCNGNEIENRAPYWVATDYMEKAKNTDPSLAEECNSMIAQYAKYFPAASDAFMYDIIKGQSYTVSCGGLRATTVVRTQN